MVPECVIPSMKHVEGGVIVKGCFSGDTVGDLVKIKGTLNQHGYYSIMLSHYVGT